MNESPCKCCIHTLTGEGQFGRVFKALAEGICPQDNNRKIVAIKTVKGKTIQNLFSVCTSAGNLTIAA